MTDNDIPEIALGWHRAGRGAVLATVVETWGSAPRPPGALLAVRDDGVVSGSVSGGCVEDDLIARTKASLNLYAESVSAMPARPAMLAYGVMGLAVYCMMQSLGEMATRSSKAGARSRPSAE